MTTQRGRGTPPTTGLSIESTPHRDRTVLVLGGWSPGPLYYLLPWLEEEQQEAFRVRIVQPAMEMPPLTCGWCAHWQVILLFGLYACFVWLLFNSVQSLVAVLLVIVGTFLWIRLLVACAVHLSIESSVEVCQKLLTEYEVDLVLGFSWGGAVLAELLTESQQRITTTLQGPLHIDDAVHSQTPPAMLLMAPTTALVAKLNIFRPKDAVLRLGPLFDAPITVVHATSDAVFCPHQERWRDKPGIDLCILHDDHVFLRPSSERRVKEIVHSMLQHR